MFQERLPTLSIGYIKSRGVVERVRMGTAFPHIFQVLLQNEFEAALKWLFFQCVPTPFLLQKNRVVYCKIGLHSSHDLIIILYCSSLHHFG